MITTIVNTKLFDPFLPGKLISSAHKCVESFEYFAEKYCKIDHPINGTLHLNLNDLQKDMKSSVILNSEDLVEKFYPRQSGKTTFLFAYAVYQALFFHKHVLFATHQNYPNVEYKKLEKLFSEGSELRVLADFLVNDIKFIGKNKIEFLNGGSITFIKNNQCVTGMSYDLVLVDEFDFMEKTAYELIKTRSTHKVIAFSTVNN